MAFYCYIVTDGRNGTLYTGSSDNLENRLRQHLEKTFGGFTAKYGVFHLVWFEEHSTRHSAFVRERRIKEWARREKIGLIEACNPDWNDLSETFDQSGWVSPRPDTIVPEAPRRPLPRKPRRNPPRASA